MQDSAISTVSDSVTQVKVFFLVNTKDFRRAALITKGNVIRNVKEAGYYMAANIQEIKLKGGKKDFTVRLAQPEKDSSDGSFDKTS